MSKEKEMAVAMNTLTPNKSGAVVEGSRSLVNQSMVAVGTRISQGRSGSSSFSTGISSGDDVLGGGALW